ncbi:hypothetical protein, partial [Ideonella sp.]|uniref:hypothetical protein n=1 Tax=Ideonella sp. TaxID=1929293 RepID=UPI0035AEE2C2
MAVEHKDAWSRLVDETLDREQGPASAWLAALPLPAPTSPDTLWPPVGDPAPSPAWASEAGEPQPGDTVGTYRLVRP